MFNTRTLNMSVSTCKKIVFCIYFVFLALFSMTVLAGPSSSLPTPLTLNTPLITNKSLNEQFYSINLVAGEGVSIVVDSRVNSGSVDLRVFSPSDLVNHFSRVNFIQSGSVRAESFVAEVTGTYVFSIGGTAQGEISLAAYSAFFNANITDSARSFFGTAFTSRYISSELYSRTSYQDFFRFETKQGESIAIEFDIIESINTTTFKVLNRNLQEVTTLAHQRIGSKGVLSFTPVVSDVYFLEITNTPERFKLKTFGIPTNQDSDNDGLSNTAEYFRGLSPFNVDTNGDGVSDMVAVSNGATGRYQATLTQAQLAAADAISRAAEIPYFNESFHVEKGAGDRYLKFVMNAGERFTVKTSALRNSRLTSTAPSVAVLHEFAPNVLIKNDLITEGRVVTSDFVASISGTYYLKLSGQPTLFDIAIYQGFSTPGVVDESRSFHGSFNTSKYLTEGRHEFTGDETFFRFEAIKGETVAITYSPSLDVNSSRMFLDVFFEDKQLNRLNFFQGVSHGQQRRLEFVAASSGLYYVRSRLQISSGQPTPGNYWLEVSGIQADRDSDGDGLSNTAEYQRGLNPFNSDTNGNGVVDFAMALSGKLGIHRTEWLAEDFATANSIQNAKLLPYFNHPLTLHINRAANYIKFDLDEGETVAIYVKATLDTSSMWYQVFDPHSYNDNKLNSRRSVRSGQTDIFEFTARQAGTYAINFEGYYGLIDFAVIKGFSNPDVTDKDRTFFSQPLLSTYIQNGSFELNGADRYFRFEGRVGDNIDITLQPSINGGALDYQLIAPGVSNPVVTGRNLADGVKETISYHVAVNGVYYLRVYSSNSSVFANGDIGISISGIRDDLDEDGDGLSNTAELVRGTDVFLPDTNFNRKTDYEMARSGLVGKYFTELTSSDVRSASSMGAARMMHKNETFSYQHNGGNRYFGFTAKQGDDIAVLVRVLMNRGTVRVSLLNEHSRTLSSKQLSANQSGDNELLTFSAPYTGTFYVQVNTPYSGTMELNIMDGYTTQGIYDDHRRIYTDFSISKRLYPGRYLRSSMRDTDFYRIEVRRQSNIRVTVTPRTVNDNGFMNFSLHNTRQLNQRLGYASVRNGQSYSFTIDNAQPGVYYLAILANSSHGYVDIQTSGFSYPQYVVDSTLGAEGPSDQRGTIERYEQVIQSGSKVRFVVTANPGYRLSKTVLGNCPRGRWLDDNTYETGHTTSNCRVEFVINPERRKTKGLPLWLLLQSNNE